MMWSDRHNWHVDSNLQGIEYQLEGLCDVLRCGWETSDVVRYAWLIFPVRLWMRRELPPLANTPRGEHR